MPGLVGYSINITTMNDEDRNASFSSSSETEHAEDMGSGDDAAPRQEIKMTIEEIQSSDDAPVPVAQIAAELEQADEAVKRTMKNADEVAVSNLNQSTNNGEPASDQTDLGEIHPVEPEHERNSSVAFYHVEARPVEDEPDVPIYDALPIENKPPWYFQRQKRLAFGLFVLLVGSSSAAAGAMFASPTTPTTTSEPTGEPTSVSLVETRYVNPFEALTAPHDLFANARTPRALYPSKHSAAAPSVPRPFGTQWRATDLNATPAVLASPTWRGS